jgi:hypothetical protein
MKINKMNNNEIPLLEPLNDSIKNDYDPLQFIKKLISDGSEAEKLNYAGFLKALKGGILDKHRGRFVFIYKGKILNKSFRLAHEVYDHIPSTFCSFPTEDATVVYVPLNLN